MFWKTVGRWVLLAIAVPIGAAALRKWGESIERRKGATRMSALLRRAASSADVVSGRNGRRGVTARR